MEYVVNKALKKHTHTHTHKQIQNLQLKEDEEKIAVVNRAK
jgi:hypothetical protein